MTFILVFKIGWLSYPSKAKQFWHKHTPKTRTYKPGSRTIISDRKRFNCVMLDSSHFMSDDTNTNKEKSYPSEPTLSFEVHVPSDLLPFIEKLLFQLIFASLVQEGRIFKHAFILPEPLLSIYPEPLTTTMKHGIQSPI